MRGPAARRRAAQLLPHLRRLRARGSASAIAQACLREARLRGGARLIDARLARAGRGGGPVVVGPFVGEIGFELLYWVPFLRRLLRRHRIAPARVTAISRGGAEPWYQGIADGYVDALDLLSPGEFGERLARRRAETGDRKQLTAAELDLELLAGAEDRLDAPEGVVVHPSLLFTRLRYLWAGERDLETLRSHVEFAPLAPTTADLPADLPDRFVAVKAYHSDCLPETDANARFVAELVERLAERVEVVQLPAGFAFDDHAAAAAPQGIRSLEGVEPRRNLAVQTAVIAASEGLVATYGGFSYLAPFTGVEAASFYSDQNFNPVHLEVLREACEDLSAPPYVVADVHAGDLSELAGKLAAAV